MRKLFLDSAPGGCEIFARKVFVLRFIVGSSAPECSHRLCLHFVLEVTELVKIRIYRFPFEVAKCFFNTKRVFKRIGLLGTIMMGDG